MRRGAWTRRWIAASGGVLVNGLILGALVLIEEPAPMVVEPPVIVLELERPQRPKAARRAPSAPTRSKARSSASSNAPITPTIGEGASAGAASAEGPAATPSVDPRWRVDPRAVERWRITEGVPEWGWGRYHRACKGYSSEHMTDEEKDRCYGAWAKPRLGRTAGASRPKGPRVGGPASAPGQPEPVENSEKLWKQRETEPPPWVKEAARQERCKAYRNGGRMPSLLKGGCL